MELIRLRGKGQLTLPDDVRREAHLAEGDYLAVTIRDGAIVLEPKAVVDAAQAWFWSDEWQRGEREAADVASAIRQAIHEEWTVRDEITGSWRPVRLADIAILLPARTSLDFLEDALDAAGVAYKAESSSLVYQAPEVRDLCQAEPPARTLLRSAMRQLSLSARGFHRILKVARTIADLEGVPNIQVHHLAEALQYRTRVLDV